MQILFLRASSTNVKVSRKKPEEMFYFGPEVWFQNVFSKSLTVLIFQVKVFTPETLFLQQLVRIDQKELGNNR